MTFNQRNAMTSNFRRPVGDDIMKIRPVATDYSDPFNPEYADIPHILGELGGTETDAEIAAIYRRVETRAGELAEEHERHITPCYDCDGTDGPTHYQIGTFKNLCRGCWNEREYERRQAND